jgi:hypothetical protein
VPALKFDRRRVVGDAEDIAVDSVKILAKLGQSTVVADSVRPQRHLEFPDLVRVTSLDGELDRRRQCIAAGSVDEFARTTLKASEDAVDSREVKLDIDCIVRSFETARQVGNECACGAKDRSDRWDDHFGTSQLTSDGHGIKSGSATAPNQHRASRIDSLPNRNLLNSANHSFSGDPEHCSSRVLHAHAEWPRDVVFNR